MLNNRLSALKFKVQIYIAHAVQETRWERNAKQFLSRAALGLHRMHERGQPQKASLPKRGLFLAKGLHLQGLKWIFQWPEVFLMHPPPLPAAWKLVGWVFLAGHSAKGIILDSANKKEGEMDTGWEAGVVRH